MSDLPMIDLHFSAGSEDSRMALLLKNNQKRTINELSFNLRSKGFTGQLIGAPIACANKKPSANEIKAYLPKLLEMLNYLGVTLLVVTDTTYFNKLVGIRSGASEYAGMVMPCVIEDYTHMRVLYSINPYLCVINPDNKPVLERSLQVAADWFAGCYVPPGENIIHKAYYPSTLADIKFALDELLTFPELSCDTEAFSLKHYSAGLGTIAFAIDEHNGIAFDCQHSRDMGQWPELRKLLRDFFDAYTGNMIYHNANFDIKILVFQLYMQGVLWDVPGMLTGIERLTRKFDDTKIITYLATNSAAGNNLGLKTQAQEFTGKYSQEEINDITKIPLPLLLEYNLVDSMATFYVRNKHWNTMVADQQLDIYTDLFKPAIKQILQMELTGLPVNKERVLEVDAELTQIADKHLHEILNNPILNRFMQEHWLPLMVDAKNNKLKKKRVSVEDFADTVFNPGSPTQLRELLFNFIGFPVLNTTPTKQPSVDADTMADLLAYIKEHDPEQTDIMDLLKAIMAHAKVSTILSTFIPALKTAVPFPDGSYRVFGCFNLGGTVSGRLSSSDPNLQNLPSSGKLGKLIKSCIQAPKGWLFSGLDFASLEDRISALTTKDPEKLKVYIDGFDGHCLRAYAYFGDQMPKVVIPTEGKAYRYEADDGTVAYYHESDPELQTLIQTVCLS